MFLIFNHPILYLILPIRPENTQLFIESRPFAKLNSNKARNLARILAAGKYSGPRQ